jgi:hypothetical protein
MHRKNTVKKISEHVVARSRDRCALSLGDKGGVPLDPLEPLLTVNEAAAILRCSRHSLNRWRLTGESPKFLYVGRSVRYTRAALADFVASSTRVSTSDRQPRYRLSEQDALEEAS